ncbi:universal stress protein [Cocleimonas sp. KMM 6892]|uniref:universal stress protein n=1 Tax=unclassified Cocleimonas TaxID=2639732 RepID=UPI002DB77E54|nr:MULTISPECIES: universal stress protein [unclassified Cocleimonas]MEB8431056.1 universal stress protein [Cocleimonas sp. KMM 6892]MEC4714172.1 universal stress protein [Cocleimonas sp. KMM 6895]MEC4743503.1 universal stress protein [Cocleimonas sp. KMM 6896]
MQQFKNILLDIQPEDSEVKGSVALDKAITLAKKNGSKLTLFSVLKEPLGLFRNETLAPQLLASAIEERREWLQGLMVKYDDIDVTIHVIEGIRYLEIIRQVLREQHDLVITSTEENKGIRKRLFGTTSMNLMRQCPCPVWVVKRNQPQPYKRILAAVDPTESDVKKDSLNPLILQLAADMARKENAELHIIGVKDSMDRRYVRRMTKEDVKELISRLESEYDQRIDNLLKQVDFAGLNPQMHLVDGNPVERIPELVVSDDIDLLVMGTVCRTGITGFLIGNTAEVVLDQVNCSVLTLKPEGFVTPVTL